MLLITYLVPMSEGSKSVREIKSVSCEFHTIEFPLARRQQKNFVNFCNMTHLLRAGETERERGRYFYREESKRRRGVVVGQ